MNDRLRRCDFVQQNHTPHPALRATFSSRRRLGLVRTRTAKQQFICLRLFYHAGEDGEIVPAGDGEEEGAV